MARYECAYRGLTLLQLLIIGSACLVQLARCDERQAAETERLRNTPPELLSADATDPQAQARFLPFSASFSLSAGGGNAQSFSIASGPDGIGLAQSNSQAAGGGNAGNPSYTASQSSSIAAGVNGISASDSNAFAGNHPLYGPTSQASGNSFAAGQAASSAHGDVVNGQAVSGAQSSVGGTQAQASSAAQTVAHRPTLESHWSNSQPNYGNGNTGGSYYHNSRERPSLSITVTDDNTSRGQGGGWFEVPDRDPRDGWRAPDYCKNYDGWYRDPRCRRPMVQIGKPNGPTPCRNCRDPRDHSRPSVQISPATASSSAQSGVGGLSIGQSLSQSGPHRPSLTLNQVEASGTAQAHAQGASTTIQQQPHHHHHNHNRPGKLEANLSSGSISANSRPGGFAQGSSIGSTAGGSSSSKVTGSSSNGGSVHGSASSGSIVHFPGPSTGAQIIPPEFVRSNRPRKQKDSLDQFVTDLEDTVYDIFDY